MRRPETSSWQVPRKSCPKGLRKCGGRKDDEALELTKKPASGVGCGRFGFFDGAKVAVICPTCQCSRQAALAARYLTKLRYDASASTSSAPRCVATSGIGDPGVEWYPWPHCSSLALM
jgi:hypothetical protein